MESKSQKSSNPSSNRWVEEAPDLDPEKVRLVFLDIDGVLISTKTAMIVGAWARTAVDYTLYDGGWFNSPQKKVLEKPAVKYIESVDKYAVGLLNLLMKSVNAHIVLSSTWRLGLDVYQIRIVLEEMGIDPKRVIGRTSPNGDKRGHQIANFLAGCDGLRCSNGYDHLVREGWLLESLEGVKLNVESYVILDDVPQFLPEQQSVFIRTDEHEGLTFSEVLLAGSYLSGKDFESWHLEHGENCEESKLYVPKGIG